MKPVSFPEANKMLGPPKGMDNCSPLDVYCDNKVCISRWTPSWKERLKLLFFGDVWLYVVSGNTQPPVSVTADDPWQK